MGWIVEDDDGYFWIAGRGMLRVSRADLDAVAEGRKRAVEPRAFGVADGMRAGSEFAFGVTPSAWKGRGDKLYFATYSGMMEIDPARLAIDRRRPAGADRTRNGRPAEAGCRRWVGPRRGQSRIPLHRPHLSLSGVHAVPLLAGRVRCAAGWKPATGAPLTTPTFHPASTASAWWRRNTDGAWNESGASFPLEARPRFYQTIWFAALCLVAASAAGVAFYQHPCAKPAPERAQAGAACRGTHRRIAPGDRGSAARRRVRRTRPTAPRASFWPT